MGTNGDRPVRSGGLDPPTPSPGRVTALLGLRFLAEVGLLACLAGGGCAAVLGGVVLAAFLVMIPARGHEPAPPPRRPKRLPTS